MTQANTPQLRWDERDINDDMMNEPFVITGEGKVYVLQQLHYDFEMVEIGAGKMPAEKRVERWVDIPVNKLEDKQ